MLPFDHERQLASVLVDDARRRPPRRDQGRARSGAGRCVHVRRPLGSTPRQRSSPTAPGWSPSPRGPAMDMTTLAAGDERGPRPRRLPHLRRPPEGRRRAPRSRSSERLGVEVKIITGDNGLVAAKVCADIGRRSAPASSAEARSRPSTTTTLEAAIAATTVFARISPDQKSRIIKVARRTGKDVAFLGDGVNDAVALHHADVGISVDSGTDVAKDAADVVLLDKDLGVLADGVMEGRRIFANTMKYVLMATSSNFGNMFSAAGASVFLSFLPMLPSQILLNNLLYNTGQLVIPTDQVDPEALARPAAWDMRFIRRFMSVFGPVSSIFDFAHLLGHARRYCTPATSSSAPAGSSSRSPPRRWSSTSSGRGGCRSSRAGRAWPMLLVPDRRRARRRGPALHRTRAPARLHAAAGDLLPAAVRDGRRLPPAGRAREDALLPGAARARHPDRVSRTPSDSNVVSAAARHASSTSPAAEPRGEPRRATRGAAAQPRPAETARMWHDARRVQLDRSRRADRPRGAAGEVPGRAGQAAAARRQRPVPRAHRAFAHFLDDPYRRRS